MYQRAINATVAPDVHQPTKLVAIAQVAGLIGIAMLAIAGPGYRIGGLPLGVALLGAALGFVILILAFITGCIGLLIKRRSVNHSRAAVWIILLAGTMTIIAVFWIFRLRGAAPIHDITTDLADPPQFKDVVPLRAAAHALNPTEYQRAQSMMGREIDVPAEQRKAFPNLRPLIVPQAPAQALQLAEQAVRKMGWDVVVVVLSEKMRAARLPIAPSTYDAREIEPPPSVRAVFARCCRMPRRSWQAPD